MGWVRKSLQRRVIIIVRSGRQNQWAPMSTVVNRILILARVPERFIVHLQSVITTIITIIITIMNRTVGEVRIAITPIIIHLEEVDSAPVIMIVQEASTDSLGDQCLSHSYLSRTKFVPLK